MPKKSKREKMMADVRRRAQTAHVRAVSPTPEALPETSSTYQFRLTSTAKTQQKTATGDTLELTAIKKDLAKTMVLAVVAVGVELALYWFGKGKI